MTMIEAPHDEHGFYTCECGRDRDGRPYNRRSVMHTHHPYTTLEQMEQATEIVRALAAVDAKDLQCYGDCGCPFCGVDSNMKHDPTCVWRRAREWVRRNAH